MKQVHAPSNFFGWFTSFGKENAGLLLCTVFVTYVNNLKCYIEPTNAFHKKSLNLEKLFSVESDSEPDDNESNSKSSSLIRWQNNIVFHLKSVYRQDSKFPISTYICSSHIENGSCRCGATIRTIPHDELTPDGEETVRVLTNKKEIEILKSHKHIHTNVETLR